MKHIRCIIVDDERESREGLRMLLETDPELEIVAVCQDGIEAIEAIRDRKPDLVFLDIQMPGINGFEVVATLGAPQPAIIFVTAFDQYAIKAFEVHALDYLLKPYSDERLFQSLRNAKNKLGSEPGNLDEFIKKGSYPTANELVDLSAKSKLVFKTDGKVHFLDYNALMWVEAYDYYVKIHVKDHFYVLRESMKRLEERLPPHIVRVHKSAIVNTHFVESITRLPNNELALQLSQDTQVKVSRTRKQAVLSVMQQDS